MAPETETATKVSPACGIPEDCPDRIKVLLVDDSPDKLLALESVLDGESLDLVKAGSGPAALRELLRHDFALILLDVHMPGMDGFETAGLIRSRKRSEHTPIIFITALGPEAGMLSRAYALGAVDFIFSPVEPAILKAKVGAFVDLQRIHQEVNRQAAVLRENATRLRWANRETSRKAAALRREVETRKEAEAELEHSRESLRDSNALLERKVRERTAELVELNTSLQKEIQVRTEAEARIQASLKEKEVLLKEVHHRVKNNLQIVSSLLRLQSGKVEDATVQGLLLEARNRVQSIALVHDRLYRSKDLGHIDFSGYLRELARQVFSSLGAEDRGIALEVEAREMQAAMDFAVPCGLVLHELLTNALKHAFARPRPAGSERPKVAVRSFLREDGLFELRVEDNGAGPPPGLDPGNTRSLGMRLVSTLVRQMGGDFEIVGSAGMTVRVVVPPAKRSEAM